MSETHIAKCDICGVEKPMQEYKPLPSSTSTWYYPNGWNVMVGVVNGWHCPECLEKVKEFVRQLKEAGR
jgi:hypothetical protein